jgi:hypothetical protein
MRAFLATLEVLALFRSYIIETFRKGNVEGAIQIEKFSDQVAKTYGVDMLCGYSAINVQAEMGTPVFQRICAEHSAVRSIRSS